MIGLHEGYGSSDTGERVVSALPALVRRAFDPATGAPASLGLESRPPQTTMAEAVATALAADAALLCEAPTGVGKTLAYLVPGLIQASLAKRVLVVSTHTIALQQQLLRNDLALVRRFLAAHPETAPHAEFKAALLLGRGNYLCPHRLALATKDQRELFADNTTLELARVAAWAKETKTGIVEELSPPPSPEVWEHVNADGGACNRQNCNPSNCHYQRAKALVREAQVVVVNHSLFFTLLAGGYGPNAEDNSPGILLPRDMVVLDEAHTVPEVAAQHFGQFVSSAGVDRLLRRLYNPRTKKGLLNRGGLAEETDKVKAALSAAEIFFLNVRAAWVAVRESARLRQPNWADPVLRQPLAELLAALRSKIDRLPEGSVRDEWTDAADRLAATLAALDDVLLLNTPGQVYWVERTGRLGSGVALRSAPLDVAPTLRQTLFGRRTALVLTSATLGEGPRMDGFRDRVGGDSATLVRVPSPFDYPRQMRVFIARDCPAPETGQPPEELYDFLAETILHCASRLRGGTLALFTSYGALRGAADRLRGPWQALGRPLWQQGVGESRMNLVRAFAEAGNGLLLGTASFWTGVDVPGPALSQVIVTRLPFENPTEPLAEARAEALRLAGRNPFAELTLPDAIIQFRQGCGRLIRRRDDLGTLTLLDSRLLHKSYGRRFLATLPQTNHTVFRRETLATDFRPWEAPPLPKAS